MANVTNDDSIFSNEITEFEDTVFSQVISTELSEKQKSWIINPEDIYPRQKTILAVHWHPEWIPLDLVEKRIANMFPNMERSLIIPTQHNQFLTHHGYCGAEIDCFSSEFNQKVQLLIHCNEEQTSKAGVFDGMLNHTSRYRSTQLLELVESIINPKFEDRLEEAVAETGVSEPVVTFLKVQTGKFKELLLKYESVMDPLMIKNKLLRNYVDCLRPEYDPSLINHAQLVMKSVKEIVKRNFRSDYFYETREVIEEARSFNAGIVIPHPEQFWPILLANYDVDGIEVWNPQSRQYTEFLINTLNRINQTRRVTERELLVFMGDDCHLGEKVRAPEVRDPDKANRQIGLQPNWDDIEMRKSLIKGGFSRESVIEEYKKRLI